MAEFDSVSVLAWYGARVDPRYAFGASWIHLHEREAHGLGVAGAGGVEIGGRHRDVVKRHARTFSAPRSLDVVPIAPRPLHASDLDPDPFEQFRRWYDDAAAHGQLQPDAMVVATSTPDGRPSARMVLLRGVDARGFCFYTNFASRKGRELAANPHAGVALHWPEVLRQVRATGAVVRVADEESDAYWFSRPRESRISAWASAQSEEIANRDALEARVAELEARFTDVDVPRPDGWGGFRVIPDEIEFWQHRDDRLHDRFLYVRVADGGWRISRLQP